MSLIARIGEGTLFAKMDISSAFRLLPVCPEDFCLLGFKHSGLYYIDKSLPMGCSLSCLLSENFFNISFLGTVTEVKTANYCTLFR